MGNKQTQKLSPSMPNVTVSQLNSTSTNDAVSTVTTSIDLQNTSTISYDIDHNGTSLLGEVINYRPNENRFLVHFHTLSWTDADTSIKKYSWLTLPNDKISITKRKTHSQMTQQQQFEKLTPTPFNTATYIPLFHFVDDNNNEFILFLESYVDSFMDITPKFMMHKYDPYRDEYIKTNQTISISPKVQISAHENFIFNDSGIIKQVQFVQEPAENKHVKIIECDINNDTAFNYYGIGCYIPEPFDMFYFIPGINEHYIFHRKTNKIEKIFKYNDMKFCGCRKLLFSKSLQRLYAFTDDDIYYLNMYELNINDKNINELEWHRYDRGKFRMNRMNIICLVYGHILITVGQGTLHAVMIGCWNLKEERYYSSLLSYSTYEAIEKYFTDNNNKKEGIKYGTVDNKGRLHLFSNSRHIAIGLDWILPVQIKNIFEKMFLKRFIPMHMSNVFPLELYSLIEQFCC